MKELNLYVSSVEQSSKNNEVTVTFEAGFKAPIEDIDEDAVFKHITEGTPFASIDLSKILKK